MTIEIGEKIELSELSISELERMAAELKLKQQQNAEEFLKTKEEVRRRIAPHLTTTVPDLEQGFFQTREKLENAIAMAKSAHELKKFFSDIVSSLIRMGNAGYTAHAYLSLILKNILDELCTENYLPRDFDLHVRPKLPTKEAMISDFSNHCTGSFEEKKEIITRLAMNFELVSNEKGLRQALDRAIEEATTYSATHGRFFSKNDDLKKWLIALKEELEKKQFLHYSDKRWKSSSDYEIQIKQVETQLDLYKRSVSEQVNQISSDHNQEFYKIKNLFSSGAFRDFVSQHQEKLEQINSLCNSHPALPVKKLKEHYSNFWSQLINDANKHSLSSKSQEKKIWKDIYGTIVESRFQLEQKGYLTTTFLEDKKFTICSLFEKHIQKTMAESIKRLGEVRENQIENLRESLQHAENEKEVAIAIRNSIHDIEKDHRSNSLLYNIKFIRSSSRVGRELKELKSSLENNALIPRLPEIDSRILSELRETINQYYANDTFVNNRARVAVAEKLFSELRTIEMMEDNAEIAPGLAKQHRREAFDRAIKTASTHHEAGTGFTKLLRLLYKPGKSRLVCALEQLRDRFSSGENPLLSVGYRDMVWPEIRDRFTRVVNEFAKKAEQDEQSFNSAEILKNLHKKTPYVTRENREKAFAAVRDFINQLQLAGDSEVANYVIAENIERFKSNDFWLPELGEALSIAHKAMQRDEFLKPLADSDFTKQIQSEIEKYRNYLTIAKKNEQRREGIQRTLQKCRLL